MNAYIKIEEKILCRGIMDMKKERNENKIDQMRLIAMYLPQFHRVKENDEWWGEGFTEWTAVKKAKPLFDGHEQPRKPLEDRYYDLLDKETMVWQAGLMHKYGIDGMCIYHYWFKDGRQILEKPAENLLTWKDIDMPFCLCWANESWARSWSNLKTKNIWANLFDPKMEDDFGILIEQEYGQEKEWTEHFYYLLPFFQDTRYIKIDGKPVIIIYRSSDVVHLREMIELWRKLAIEAKLPGIYVIGSNCDTGMKSILDGELHHEPQRSIREICAPLLKNGDVRRLNYRDTWETLLRKEEQFGMQPYYEGFVGYDDTPRRGREGIIIDGANPSLFEDMLVRLIRKNISNGSELVFLNAWNEWGEGMYLEPDAQYKYEYLEAVTRAKKRCIDSEQSESKRSVNVSLDTYQELQELQERTNLNLHILEQWLHIARCGESLGRYIRNIFSGEIAIYGYGFVGKILYQELEDANVPVKYIIDKNAKSIHISTPVFKFEDELPYVDNVIVTAQYYYDEIYVSLHSVMKCKIVSIEEVINECKNKYI